MTAPQPGCSPDVPVLAGPAEPVPVPPSHHGHPLADRWPLRTSLALGPLTSAVPCARAHAQLVLREWGFTVLNEDAGLVVSELISNAVEASRRLPPPPPPVRLWLVSDSTRVLIVAGDASPRPPLRMDPGLDADSGRGLRLVEAFSARWGWYPTDGGGTGKAVWAELRTPAGA